MFEYMPFNVAPWPWQLALYFFLIGTASMVFVVSAAPVVFGRVAQPFESGQKTGLIVSLVLLVVCAPLLISDLGMPERFLYPIIHFHWTSPLSWGSLFLPLFGLCIVGFGWGKMQDNDQLMKLSGIFGSLLALSMPLYTGLDLMVHQSRELWSNPTIPVLFVVLSITSGMALVSVLGMMMGGMSDEMTRLTRIILFASVGVTFWLFLGEVVTLWYGTEEELHAWQIINAEFGIRFWLLTFVIGTLVPLVILALPAFSSNPLFVTVAGVAGSVGAYTFREVLLYAGQLTQIYY